MPNKYGDMMEKSYIIYKCTCKINGKMYIGKTYNFEKRKREHICDMGNGIPFHKALCKYGLENFTWEIIDHAKSDADARDKEVYWIKELNTCIHSKNSNGYNITVGGEGGVSWNSRPIVMFDMNGNYIDEFISGMCASVLMNMDRKSIQRAAGIKYSRSGKYQWRYKDEWDGKNIGKYIRPESKRKTKIVQLDLDGYYLNAYDSLEDASRLTNTRRTGISNCLTGIIKTANKYVWVYEDEYDINHDYSVKGFKMGNGIVQMNMDYKFMQRFNNCLYAAEQIGLENPRKQYKVIHKALTSNTHQAYGFRWMKYEDYKLQYDNTEVSA